jgi:hypothetical protein
MRPRIDATAFGSITIEGQKIKKGCHPAIGWLDPKAKEKTVQKGLRRFP